MAKLYQGQPGTGDTLLFTAERRYTHLTILCANTTGTDATIRLNFCYQGASAAANNEIVPDVTIPANRTGLIEMGLVIERGDTMRALQGTASAITVTIDGLDIGKDSHSRGSSFSFFPPASGGGGGSGTNFWTYDGSTLQPDPSTVPNLDHFNVETTTDYTIDTAGAGIVSGNSLDLAAVTSVAVTGDIVDIEGATTAKLGSTTGDVTVASTSGNVDVRSTDGTVIVSSNDNDVTVESTSGNVRLSAAVDIIGGKVDVPIGGGASTLGLVINSVAIYDSGGTLVGYLPLYDTIT